MPNAQGMKIFGKILVAAAVLAALAVLVPNFIMVLGQRSNLRTVDEVASQDGQTGYECIMVLGAAVLPDGTPSPMLQERLDTGIELYKRGVAPKLLMSGDNTSDRETYDEVWNMKAYAVAAGVPSEDVFCDHAGLCTYDSAYRLYHVFGVQKAVVVSQRYHLYRALYDTASFSIQAVGVPCDREGHDVRAVYYLRELAARTSDFIKVLTRQNATYLSEPVSLDQSGDVTSW